MSIGIIIFIISIIGSIYSAMKDNSHEERKKQQKHYKPKQQGQQRQQGKGFLEKVEKTLKDIEREFDESLEKQAKKEQANDKPKKPETTPHDKKATTPSPQKSFEGNELNKKAEEMARQRSQQDKQLREDLQNDLENDLKQIRHRMDREKEKKLEMMEKRASAIISDPHLSERAKRYRLNQLSQSVFKNRKSKQGMPVFHEDEVVNGVIWSEVLEKPKRV